MFSQKNKRKGLVLRKKGFTLIEMLIVIVIIGILAAALIPRLSSARGRANDVARKADLAQVAAALVAYQIDHGSYPAGVGALSGIEADLLGAGINSIPKDPNTSKSFSGINETLVTNGQYGYVRIMKGGIANNGFVLMAGAETEGGANRVVAGTDVTKGMIHDGTVGGDPQTPYESIIPCKTLTERLKTQSKSQASGIHSGECVYDKRNDELRYIYIY